MHPRVVLADEPTAHLGGPTGERVVTALRDVASEHGAALVIVTHDERVTRLADRVFRVLDGRLMPERVRPASG
jgi:putative ABC transport system ATP-binding protein